MKPIVKPLVLFLLCSGVASTYADQTAAQRVRLETKLDATRAEPLASGSAKFEQRPDRTRFSVEAEDLMFSEVVHIYVAGAYVDSVKVDGTGFADLNLDSRLGHAVPKMFDGDLVELVNQDRDLILWGILKGRGGIIR